MVSFLKFTEWWLFLSYLYDVFGYFLDKHLSFGRITGLVLSPAQLRVRQLAITLAAHLLVQCPMQLLLNHNQLKLCCGTVAGKSHRVRSSGNA